MKGWQFKNVIEILDPITKEVDRKPMKPFMVNQLQIAFERENMMLSPFDDTLHKQLIDYEVIRIGQGGVPVYTDKNEHFVDALGLAYLAFVLEFSELTDTIKKPKWTNKIEHSPKTLGQERLNSMFNEIQMAYNPESRVTLNYDPADLPGDRPRWVKVSGNYNTRGRSGQYGWGSRSKGQRINRSVW